MICKFSTARAKRHEILVAFEFDISTTFAIRIHRHDGLDRHASKGHLEVERVAVGQGCHDNPVFLSFVAKGSVRQHRAEVNQLAPIDVPGVNVAAGRRTRLFDDLQMILKSGKSRTN